MEENNFVIRSSLNKLVSMLFSHPILVARNVKNYFKINKKINLNKLVIVSLLNIYKKLLSLKIELYIKAGKY